LKNTLLKFLKILSKKRKFQIILLIFGSIISSLLEVTAIGSVLPFITTITNPDSIIGNKKILNYIEFFSINNNADLTLFFSILFICVATLSAFGRFAIISFQTKLSYSIGADLSYKIFFNALNQSYISHIKRNSSEVITAVSTKANYVVSGVVFPLLSITNSIIVILLVIIFLININVNILLFSLPVFLFFYYIFMFFSRKILIDNSKIINDNWNEVVKVIQESIGGIKEIIIGNRQYTACDEFRCADMPLRKASATNKILEVIPRYFIELIGIIILVVWAYLLSHTEDSSFGAIPTLAVFALSAQRLLPLLQQIYASWSKLKGSEKLLSEALNYLQDEPVLYDYEFDNSNFKKTLKLNDVSFGYDLKNKVLKNINLNIKKGRKIGIIGETGSGKSTLLNVILGLLFPDEGNLFLDNTKITEKNASLLRNKISYMPQETYLKDCSIIENIAFGVDINDINIESVIKVCKQAQIYDFINNLKDGFYTRVGERGLQLSGGQCQRIGIARTLYNNKPILVMDEATSALDTVTESRVIKNIFESYPTLTIIIVAHRHSTLTRCDEIYEIKFGCVNLKTTSF
jgi:ATP-binding cassette subfamily B protein